MFCIFFSETKFIPLGIYKYCLRWNKIHLTKKSLVKTKYGSLLGELSAQLTEGFYKKFDIFIHRVSAQNTEVISR